MHSSKSNQTINQSSDHLAEGGKPYQSTRVVDIYVHIAYIYKRSISCIDHPWSPDNFSVGICILNRCKNIQTFFKYIFTHGAPYYGHILA